MNATVLLQSRRSAWGNALVLGWLTYSCATGIGATGSGTASARPADRPGSQPQRAGDSAAKLERRRPDILDHRAGSAADSEDRRSRSAITAEHRTAIELRLRSGTTRRTLHGGLRNSGPCWGSALEMDAREGGTARREALREGLVALQEADQFGGDQVDWRDAADVRPIAASHTTSVLANAQQPVDSIQAVQAYYLFAEQKLTAACQGLPGASLAFYGLGRTIVLPGTRIAHSSGKAALFQRVALSVAPQNVLAANELGVLLAQHGQLHDAERIFQQCVATDATPESWRNLAVVYARQGNEQASRSAQAAGDALAAERHRHAASQIAATAQANAAAAAEENEEEKKPGFFSRLTPKLPSMFRR